MQGDAAVRVWTSTAVLGVLGLVGLVAYGVTLPIELWVLISPGVFALSHLVSLVLFDDEAA